MITILALGWSEAIQDRRHPMHVALLLLAPLVPIAVHRFVVDTVGTTTPSAVGSDWFSFGALGLIVLTVIDGSLRAGATTLQRAQESGVLTTMFTAPGNRAAIPIALASWPMVVHIVAAVAGTGLAVMLGADLQASGIAGLILALMLGACASLGFTAAAAALGVLARRGEPVARLFTLATALLSGAVFPIDLLPAPLRWGSLALPHTHAIRLARRAMMPLPPTEAPSALSSVLWLSLLAGAAVTIGTALLLAGIRTAQREGLLAATG